MKPRFLIMMLSVVFCHKSIESMKPSDLKKSGSSGKFPRMILSLEALCVQHFRAKQTPQKYSNTLKNVSLESAERLKREYPAFLPQEEIIVTDSQLFELQEKKPELYTELVDELKNSKKMEISKKERIVFFQLNNGSFIISDVMRMRILGLMKSNQKNSGRRKNTI